MREEALTDKSAELFPELGRFKGFYLAGGTALALHIGHRVSVDFDVFTGDELPARLLERVKRTFPQHAITVTYRAPDQLNLLAGDVKMTFFQYPYPLVDDPVEFRRVSVATIREIAAMKAFSIGKRLSYKDYVDWYFLLKEEHVTLPDTIAHAQKKFGGDFNDRLFLGQLVSLDDVPDQKIDFLRDEVDREKLDAFLKQTVSNFQL